VNGPNDVDEELLDLDSLYDRVVAETVGTLSDSEAMIAAVALVENSRAPDVTEIVRLEVSELADLAFSTFGGGHDWHTLIRAAFTARSVVKGFGS